MTFRRFKQADISGICELINYELGYCVTENDLAIRINQMQKDKITVFSWQKTIIRLLHL